MDTYFGEEKMIEKIMKAVKSGNKKRGKNITIGAVVGMLLSCTVVMGAATIGVEINGIEFFKDYQTSMNPGTKFTPGGEGDPYPENTWIDNTYTNNSTLSGESMKGVHSGYGIRVIEFEEKVNIVNKGTLSATGTSGSGAAGYGLSIVSPKTSVMIDYVKNEGVIAVHTKGTLGYGINIQPNSPKMQITIKEVTNTGMMTDDGNGGSGIMFGENTIVNNLINSGLINWKEKAIDIYSHSYLSKVEKLDNSGLLIGEGTGIYVNGTLATIEELINSGRISGAASTSGQGIKVIGSAIIGKLDNSGLISGNGSTAGDGITVGESTTSIGTINSMANKGVIYGKDYAINKINTDSTLKDAYNYGLLVSGDSTKNVVAGITIVDSSTATLEDNEIKNYGLAFSYDGTNYKATADINNFGISHDVKIDDADYKIINVAATVESGSITNPESLTLEEGTLSYLDSEGKNQEESISSDKKYVLNGIKDTLKVVGKHNDLNNSVVNAYETAVVMDTDSSMLTLNNTVVNGGMKEGTTAVNIDGDGSTLTVMGDSVINIKDEGVAITVAGKNNTVVLSGNAIVNGKMKSEGNNSLVLNGKTEGSMNMLHDISGFVNMNIDNNVTFFEDTKVTGTKTVTVADTGVLTLRLKKEDTVITDGDSSSTIPIATHAFSDTDGMTIEGISPEETGTLNFITNGIGKEILVDMQNIILNNMKIKASSIIDKAEIGEGYIRLGAGSDLGGIVNPKVNKYNSLNKIYKSIYNSTDEKNLDGLRDILSMTYLGKNYDYNNATDKEQLENLLTYLNSIYTGSPYSYSSELSRRSVGMFRDIVTENQFRPNLNNWLIMGGLTHADGGTKDTYFGKNYHEIDGGTAGAEVDMKLTGAYMLAKYGYSENISLGLTLGGNKSEAKLDMAKVKGNSGYLGAFAENYRGNLTLKAGAGVQYSEYDADRRVMGGDSHSDKYSDMAYDIYLNGRYSNPMGDNFFLEPYGTLSYTYVDQDGADEGNKTLAIETDSKSFDYTVGKVGLDLKKVIPHEKGKSTLTAGVSYTKIFDGADEENITGRFKGGSDFDILVAHKNEHSIGLNAKYALELESGVLLDVKGTYSVERDSHNGSAKNKNKGEWIVGAGLGYKF